jgi:hypothetical protein
MQLHLTVDTDNPEDLVKIAQALLGAETAVAVAKTTAAAKEVKEVTKAASPAPKAAAAKKEEPRAEKPAPEAEEEDPYTLDKAVAAATKLIGDGKTDEVRSALKELGVKRVSDLAGVEGGVKTFLETLGAS